MEYVLYAQELIRNAFSVIPFLMLLNVKPVEMDFIYLIPPHAGAVFPIAKPVPMIHHVITAPH